MAEDSRMTRVSGHGVSASTKRLLRITALAAVGAIAVTARAEAALYYWSDADPGYYRPDPTMQQRRPKSRRQQTKKMVAPEKESAKPQGPVIIAISIDQQKLRIYDANGFFAETPISTGMKGHLTPMGVFSVIQKQKLHHSNIYSGAPMPYMQRITWSGIAIHAGVLPGYPASHGCIRMPMPFAMKMWNWTKMGARVVVIPGDLTPSSFSHPLLATRKVVPQPAAASEPQTDAPAATKGDKAADAAIKPDISEASFELRSTVGHHDVAKSAIEEPSAPTPLRDQTHTADASSEMLARNSVTMSDASGGNAPSHDEASAADDSAKAGDPLNMEAKSETAKSEPEASTEKHDVIASSDDKMAETKSTELKSFETGAPDDASKTADHAQASGDAIKAEAKSNDVKAEPQKADASKSNEKPDDSVKAVTDAGPSVPVEKDQNRLTDAEKPAAGTPDPAAVLALKRPGQIAVFISRKDSKLYVRQNFAPLFEMPITIAPSDRPLGTHIFTAQVDKNDANVLHWSVVSLPVPARHAERRDEDDRTSRRRKVAGAVEMRPMPVPDSPTEALDRLSIPADVMARITEALSTGSSIIVSDQGIAAGETGEGTDFIVSLR
jgi:lipoprotein-anchoring transpeptidase ErfK/SrfK